MLAKPCGELFAQNMYSQDLRQTLLQVETVRGLPKFAQERRKARGAKGRGLRYEAKVHEALSSLYGDMYVPSPWFQYKVRQYHKWLFAQPDGLLFDFHKQKLVIVEMKYNHCSEAYFQLFDKYVPLLDFFLNREEKLWEISVCEVVYWYDKATVYPKPVVLRQNIHQSRPGEMAVHICRP